MNQKAFTLIELIAVIVILSLIALVVFPAINSIIKNSKESAYETQKSELIKAGENYFIKNTDKLPEMSENSTSKVQLSTLIKEGYISEDDVKDPRDTSKTLKGYIKATYTTNQYIYEYLEQDTTILPGEQLLSKKTSSISILKANGNIYKGTNPDNYLTFSGKTWRIIRINNDNSLKIILNTPATTLQYNSNGNQDYSKSTINTYLNSTFYNTLTNKNSIQKTSWCIGKKDEECSEKTETYVGLLRINDYINSSNDTTCQEKITTCKNGNYLNKNIQEYTINKSETEIYIINNGEIQTSKSTQSLNIRPVINITAKITGGTGTQENPYKTNWK